MSRPCVTSTLLQWTYTCGNSWGVCSEGGGRLGCGPQVTSTLHCCCGYYLYCDRRHSELVLTSPSSQLGLLLGVVSIGPLVEVLLLYLVVLEMVLEVVLV